VCATLRRAEVDRAVRDAVLAFSVAGAPAGTSTTDATGRACLSVPVPNGASRVAVSFPGTSAWASSSSAGGLTGYTVPPPPPARPRRPAPPRVAHRPARPYYDAGVRAAPAPASVAQPAPPAPLPPAVQPAPLPNLQPVAGLAAAPGEGEAQMAYADADRNGGPAAQLLGAVAVTAMAGAARRRTARAFASGGR
jgi:hypothetical protein